MDLSYPIGRFDFTQTVAPESIPALIQDIAAAPPSATPSQVSTMPNSTRPTAPAAGPSARPFTTSATAT
jgi:hypothetical protein